MAVDKREDVERLDWSERNSQLDLNEYINYTLQAAVRSANDNPSLNDFWERVSSEVSRYFGMTQKEVMGLHHPFHWTFFNSKSYSPFGLEDRDLPEGHRDLFVDFERNDFVGTLSKLSRDIQNSYGNYLRARYKPFQVD